MENVSCILVQASNMEEIYSSLNRGFGVDFESGRNEFSISGDSLEASITVYSKEMGEDYKEFIKKQISGVFGHFNEVKCDNDIKINVLHQIRKSNALIFVRTTFEGEDDERVIKNSIFKTAASFRFNSALVLSDEWKTIYDVRRRVLISDHKESEVESFFPYFEAVEFLEDLSQEKIDRRNKSLDILKKRNIYVTEYLPLIEDSKDCKIRSTEEIAKRLIALSIVALYSEAILSEGISTEEAAKLIKPLIERYDAESYFSPNEKAYLENKNSTKQDQVQFAWQYENAYVMEWALKIADKLSFPTEICNVELTVKNLLKYESVEEIIKVSNRRSDTELLDEADFIYRADWACVDARVNNLQTPGNMDAGVVIERHKALNWLIGGDEAEWDDVDLST